MNIVNTPLEVLKFYIQSDQTENDHRNEKIKNSDMNQKILNRAIQEVSSNIVLCKNRSNQLFPRGISNYYYIIELDTHIEFYIYLTISKVPYYLQKDFKMRLIDLGWQIRNVYNTNSFFNSKTNIELFANLEKSQIDNDLEVTINSFFKRNQQ